MIGDHTPVAHNVERIHVAVHARADVAIERNKRVLRLTRAGDRRHEDRGDARHRQVSWHERQYRSKKIVFCNPSCWLHLHASRAAH